MKHQRIQCGLGLLQVGCLIIGLQFSWINWALLGAHLFFWDCS